MAIGWALVAAFWALIRFGDIDAQREVFLISQNEAQAARVTTFAIVGLSAVAVCSLLVFSKWLVGATRNSEWWRIWHFGDTEPFTVTTPDVATPQSEIQLHDVLKNSEVSPSLVATLIETGTSVNSIGLVWAKDP